MKITELIAILLMVGVLLYLLWQLLRSREELRREREENRRLRGLLQEGSKLAQADLEQLQRLRHDLRHYLLLAEDVPQQAEDDALEEVTTSSRESWAVSALERHYRSQAEALGFRADLRLVPPQAWEGVVPDLCLVVSNLLENGLEALQREGSG